MALDTPPTSSVMPEKQTDNTLGPPGNSSSTLADGAPGKDEYVTGAKLALVIVSLTLTVFLLMLDQSILSTAIPRITTQFHSLPDVGWYTGAYQLANASFQPLTGKFYTHLRAKHVFLVHLFVFELGSLICGVATTSNMLIGGRALAGLGASGLMNGGLTILSGAVPIEKRPLYTGILLGIGQLGILCGPLVGGALTQYVTWRWCFYINLPVGALSALVLAFIAIRDLTPKGPFSLALVRSVIPELDLPGFVLFAPASIMFLLALQFGGDNTQAWNSAVVIGLFVGAGATFLGFAVWERHVGDKAMIPATMVANRIVLLSMVQSACLMICIAVMSMWMPMYFQAVKGASPTMSGVDLLPSILSQLLIAIVSGAAVSKLGYYLPWAIFSGAVTTLGNGLISTFSATTKTATWIGYLIIVGTGRGAGMQMAFLATQHALPASLIPASLAFLIFTQNLAAAVSVIVANTIFTQSLISKIAQYAPSISAQAALAAGASASAVRALVPKGQGGVLDGMLRAYSESLQNVWYFTIGVAGLMFLCSFGMGWGDVRKDAEKKRQVEKAKV